MIPVISIVGKSNVGKTTLLEKLLPEIKRRGYRVATIKHDVHGFNICLLYTSPDKQASDIQDAFYKNG